MNPFRSRIFAVFLSLSLVSQGAAPLQATSLPGRAQPPWNTQALVAAGLLSHFVLGSDHLGAEIRRWAAAALSDSTGLLLGPLVLGMTYQSRKVLSPDQKDFVQRAPEFRDAQTFIQWMSAHWEQMRELELKPGLLALGLEESGKIPRGARLKWLAKASPAVYAMKYQSYLRKTLTRTWDRLSPEQRQKVRARPRDIARFWNPRDFINPSTKTESTRPVSAPYKKRIIQFFLQWQGLTHLDHLIQLKTEPAARPAEGTSVYWRGHYEVDLPALRDFRTNGSLRFQTYVFPETARLSPEATERAVQELLLAYRLIRRDGPAETRDLWDTLMAAHGAYALNDAAHLERGMEWLSIQGFPLRQMGRRWSANGISQSYFYPLDPESWPEPLRKRWERIPRKLPFQSAQAVGERLRILGDLMMAQYHLSLSDLKSIYPAFSVSPEENWRWASGKFDAYDSTVHERARSFGIAPEWLWNGQSRYSPLDAALFAYLAAPGRRRGERVKALRRRAGLQRVDVLQQLRDRGITWGDGAFQQFEEGVRENLLDVRLWPALADILGAPALLLLTGEPDSRRALLSVPEGGARRELARISLGIPAKRQTLDQQRAIENLLAASTDAAPSAPQGMDPRFLSLVDFSDPRDLTRRAKSVAPEEQSVVASYVLQSLQRTEKPRPTVEGVTVFDIRGSEWTPRTKEAAWTEWNEKPRLRLEDNQIALMSESVFDTLTVDAKDQLYFCDFWILRFQGADTAQIAILHNSKPKSELIESLEVLSERMGGRPAQGLVVFKSTNREEIIEILRGQRAAHRWSLRAVPYELEAMDSLSVNVLASGQGAVLVQYLVQLLPKGDFKDEKEDRYSENELREWAAEKKTAALVARLPYPWQEPLSIAPDYWWGTLYQAALKGPQHVLDWLEHPSHVGWTIVLANKYPYALDEARAGNLDTLRHAIETQIAPYEETRDFIGPIAFLLQCVPHYTPGARITADVVDPLLDRCFVFFASLHQHFFVRGMDRPVSAGERPDLHSTLLSRIDALKSFSRSLILALPPTNDPQFQAKYADMLDRVTDRHAEINSTATSGEGLLTLPPSPAIPPALQTLLNELGLGELERLPAGRAGGTLYRRVTWPARANRVQAPTTGPEALQFEMADTRTIGSWIGDAGFDLTSFDVLFSDDGRPIAIVPVLPDTIHRKAKALPHGRQRRILQDLRLRFLDLSAYYFEPRAEDPRLQENWTAFLSQHAQDQSAISRYLRDLFLPFQRLGGSSVPFALLQVRREDNETRRSMTSIPSLVDSMKVSAFVEDLRALPRDARVRTFRLIHFPTVYAAAGAAAQNVDQGYHRALLNHVTIRPDDEVMVIGPGDGPDMLEASTRTKAPIDVVGINPFEVAGTRANAEANGVAARVTVGDVFTATDGTPVFNGKRYDLILHNMSNLLREAPEHTRPQTLEDFWDYYDYGPMLQRFAQELPNRLKDGGRALIWNQGNKKRIREAFERSGLRVLEVERSVYLLTKPKQRARLEELDATDAADKESMARVRTVYYPASGVGDVLRTWIYPNALDLLKSLFPNTHHVEATDISTPSLLVPFIEWLFPTLEKALVNRTKKDIQAFSLDPTPLPGEPVAVLVRRPDLDARLSKTGEVYSKIVPAMRNGDFLVVSDAALPADPDSLGLQPVKRAGKIVDVPAAKSETGKSFQYILRDGYVVYRKLLIPLVVIAAVTWGVEWMIHSLIGSPLTGFSAAAMIPALTLHPRHRSLFFRRYDRKALLPPLPHRAKVSILDNKPDHLQILVTDPAEPNALDDVLFQMDLITANKENPDRYFPEESPVYLGHGSLSPKLGIATQDWMANHLFPWLQGRGYTRLVLAEPKDSNTMKTWDLTPDDAFLETLFKAGPPYAQLTSSSDIKIWKALNRLSGGVIKQRELARTVRYDQALLSRRLPKLVWLQNLRRNLHARDLLFLSVREGLEFLATLGIPFTAAEASRRLGVARDTIYSNGFLGLVGDQAAPAPSPLEPRSTSPWEPLFFSLEPYGSGRPFRESYIKPNRLLLPQDGIEIKRIQLHITDDLHPVPTNEIPFIDHRDLGLLTVAEEGVLQWMELSPGARGAIYAPGHGDCHVLSFHATREGKTVIGHMHLYAGTGNYTFDAAKQYLWVLDYLHSSGLFTNPEIVLAIDERWHGFPEGTTLQALTAQAESRGIKIRAAFERLSTLSGLPRDLVETTVLVLPDQFSIQSEGAKTFERLYWDGSWSTPSRRFGASQMLLLAGAALGLQLLTQKAPESATSIAMAGFGLIPFSFRGPRSKRSQVESFLHFSRIFPLATWLGLLSVFFIFPDAGTLISRGMILGVIAYAVLRFWPGTKASPEDEKVAREVVQQLERDLENDPLFSIALTGVNGFKAAPDDQSVLTGGKSYTDRTVLYFPWMAKYKPLLRYLYLRRALGFYFDDHLAEFPHSKITAAIFWNSYSHFELLKRASIFPSMVPYMLYESAFIATSKTILYKVLIMGDQVFARRTRRALMKRFLLKPPATPAYYAESGTLEDQPNLPSLHRLRKAA